MNKILIIGPSWVGDMVMSQCLYKDLKRQHPDAIIDVMAPAWCKPVLERMPEVTHAIEMPLGHGEFNLFGRRALGHLLKTKQYDVAYVLPNSAKSALIPIFANIGRRIGWRGEMRFGLLTELRHNKKKFQYMAERYVALARPKNEMTDSNALGGLSQLPKPELRVDHISQRIAINEHGLNVKRPIVGLCPGAEFGPAKQWPAIHYARVANEMIKRGEQVWIFGSKKDRTISDKIMNYIDEDKRHHAFNLAGTTSLIEAVDLLACCHTVVSNDSGLMHIAASVGCAVIGLYGSTSPDYTPPLTDLVEILHTDIACRPCFKRECPYTHMNCMTLLMPDQVFSAMQRLQRKQNQENVIPLHQMA